MDSPQRRRAAFLAGFASPAPKCRLFFLAVGRARRPIDARDVNYPRRSNGSASRSQPHQRTPCLIGASENATFLYPDTKSLSDRTCGASSG